MNLSNPSSPCISLIYTFGVSAVLDLLAIHPIRRPSMTRNTIPKVLDIKRPLESARKESPEGGDERGEGRHDEEVDLVGDVGDCRELLAGLPRRNPNVSSVSMPRVVRRYGSFAKDSQERKPTPESHPAIPPYAKQTPGSAHTARWRGCSSRGLGRGRSCS